jgi:branched-chain amino acid transport system substrate-binding protein
VRKLAADPDVAVIHGPSAGSALVVGAPVLVEAKIATVAPTANAPFPAGVQNDWTFRTGVIQTNLIDKILADFKRIDGFQTLAIVRDLDNAFSVAEAKDIETVSSKVGVKLVANEAIRTGDKDFSALLAKLAAAKPDAIWLGSATNESIGIVTQARQRQMSTPFVGGQTLGDTTLFAKVGAAGDGILTYGPYDPSSARPLVQSFQKAYKAKYGDDPTFFAAKSYDAMYLIADAIKRAGSTDRDAIRQALGQTQNLERVTGIYNYKGCCDNLTPDYVVQRAQNGQLVPVKP